MIRRRRQSAYFRTMSSVADVGLLSNTRISTPLSHSTARERMVTSIVSSPQRVGMMTLSHGDGAEQSWVMVSPGGGTSRLLWDVKRVDQMRLVPHRAGVIAFEKLGLVPVEDREQKATEHV